MIAGEVVLEEKDLPVLLPKDVEFKPDGKSPLAKSEEFVNCKCPKCGKDAKREVDTLDTFVCSSWYELRYPFNKENNVPFVKGEIDEYVPVDTYVGGKEHAAMHLIYSRFIYKALRDGGYLKSDEPFTRLIHQGLILGPDGNKMSKSKGNTVSPDDYVEKYGSDALRLWLMFGYAYEEGGPWNEDGIKGISKYIQRVENLADRIISNEQIEKEISKEDIEELKHILNRTIFAVEKDIIRFSFNTAVAKLMELTNEMIRIENKYGNVKELRETFRTFVNILAPIAPHLSEELWEKLGEKESVHLTKYPKYDENYLERNTITIAVQINGKLKDTIEIEKGEEKEKVLAKAKQKDKIITALEGKEIVKEIYVQDKIVNIVVR